MWLIRKPGGGGSGTLWGTHSECRAGATRSPSESRPRADPGLISGHNLNDGTSLFARRPRQPLVRHMLRARQHNLDHDEPDDDQLELRGVTL